MLTERLNSCPSAHKADSQRNTHILTLRVIHVCSRDLNEKVKKVIMVRYSSLILTMTVFSLSERARPLTNFSARAYKIMKDVTSLIMSC